jgi:hypothetical protein
LYLITYRDDQFYIELKYDSVESHEDFQSEVDYLKWLYIAFNDTSKRWKIPEDRIQEIILWMERDKKKYQISSSCADKFIEIQNQYKREVEFYRNRIFDESILNEDIKLKNFQLQGINWRLQRSGYIDAHDAGCGKTLQNICVFSYLYKNNLIDGIIILVPIGLSYHWQQEILEKVNVFKKDDIQIIDNFLKIKPFEKFKDKKILIIRHDLYADCIASYKKDYDSKKSLKDLRWKTANYVNIKNIWGKENIFVCLDEGHSFKHTTSVKTKAIFSTKKYFNYKAFVSATPWINGTEDAYSPITFIDHSIIPMPENAFKLWISESIGNKWDKYAVNSYNIDNIQKLMQSYQHILTQVRKEDLEEIKTIKQFRDIKCQVLPEQLKLYEKITEYELHILQEDYDVITWKLLLEKLYLICEVFDNPLLLKKRKYSNDDIHNILNNWKIENDSKFIYTKNRLEDLIEEKNKKVILYDIHPVTIEVLAEKFKKYNPLVIHGGLKIKDKELDRKEKENLFNFNKDYKLIILSSYTSSQGINLQYGSSNIIFYTLPWDSTVVKQGQERTDRVNSITNSTIEFLYYPETIDAYRYKKVINRIEFNKKLDKEVSQEELNLLLNGRI